MDPGDKRFAEYCIVGMAHRRRAGFRVCMPLTIASRRWRTLVKLSTAVTSKHFEPPGR
jgi:hypothetical protein